MINTIKTLEYKQKFRIKDIYNVNEWQSLIISNEYNQERQMDSSFFSTLPSSFLGFCAVCNKWQLLTITAHHSLISPKGSILPAYSETSVCCECKTNSRMRAAIEIMSVFKVNKHSNIYLSEQSTNLFKAMKKRFSNITGSEYLGNKVKFGEIDDDGYRNEDLQALTFDDSSFEFVISLDVLEHIPNPFLAINEMLRILKFNGVAVITFPFFPTLSKSFERSKLEKNKIKYIAPPVYHGDPINKKGILVFNDLGFDIINHAKSISKKATLINYWCYRSGHFGSNRFALIVQK